MMTSLNSSLNVVVESRKELNGQDEDNSQPENNDDIAVEFNVIIILYTEKKAMFSFLFCIFK